MNLDTFLRWANEYQRHIMRHPRADTDYGRYYVIEGMKTLAVMSANPHYADRHIEGNSVDHL